MNNVRSLEECIGLLFFGSMLQVVAEWLAGQLAERARFDAIAQAEYDAAFWAQVTP
jgi:hypothetical protein